MNARAVSPSLLSFPGSGLPGTTITLNAGPFSVTELGGPQGGYHQLSAEGCSGAAVDGDYTCVITSEQDAGRIIVRKAAGLDDAPPQAFGFAASWGPGFSLVGGEPHDSGLMGTGIYSVAELTPLPEGWALTGASCDDGSAVSAIGVSPGETVTCTFANGGEESIGPGELPYTGPQPFLMPMLLAGLWALLAGLGMLVWPRMRRRGGA